MDITIQSRLHCLYNFSNTMLGFRLGNGPKCLPKLIFYGGGLTFYGPFNIFNILQKNTTFYDIFYMFTTFYSRSAVLPASLFPFF